MSLILFSFFVFDFFFLGGLVVEPFSVDVVSVVGSSFSCGFALLTIFCFFVLR